MVHAAPQSPVCTRAGTRVLAGERITGILTDRSTGFNGVTKFWWRDRYFCWRWQQKEPDVFTEQASQGEELDIPGTGQRGKGDCIGSFP